MKFNKDVTPDEFAKLNKLLSSFEKKEVKKIGNNVQDLMYAAKLAEHIQQLEDFSGHLKYFKPDGPLSIEKYPRHRMFFDATAKHKEVLFMAGNRVGKSLAGAYCTACWTTGIYPDWWKGRVFRKNIKVWACADRNNTFKESVQETLLGKSTSIGTGMLPMSRGNAPGIVDIVTKPNTGGMVDLIVVKSDMSKQPSIISSRTYEQGVKAFYGAAVDAIWEDEESDSTIHNECLLRTMTTQGIVILTYTPLHGLTPLTLEFKETATLLTEGMD